MRIILILILVLEGCSQLIGQSVRHIQPRQQQFVMDDIHYRIEYIPGADYGYHRNFFIAADRRHGYCWQNGNLAVLDLATWKTLAAFATPFPAMTVSPDYCYALLYDPSGKIYRYNRQEQKATPLLGDQDSQNCRQWWSYGSHAISAAIYGSGIVSIDLATMASKKLSPFAGAGNRHYQGIIAAERHCGYYLAQGLAPHSGDYCWCTLDLRQMQITARRYFPGRAPVPLALAPAPYFYAASERIHRVNCRSLEVVCESKPLGRIFWAGLLPDGQALYVLTAFSGLFILAPDSLEILAQHRYGRSVNAYSMGVTFSNSGNIAGVTTPYQGLLTIIDTRTHHVQAHIDIGPACAAFLIANKNQGRCFVIPTKLPYE